MKIIDLLNKISNGEEVPEKIKYEEEIFERVISGMNINDYLDEDGDYLFQEYDWLQNINDEIEIIEEDKKIEKMVYCEENTFKNMKECTYLSPEEKRLLDSNFKELVDKINEIIDVINKGDK